MGECSAHLFDTLGIHQLPATQPVWLIEGGVYGEEADLLLTAIRKQGMIGECIPHQALKKGLVPSICGQQLGDGVCVIGYGTFPFVRQIQLHHRWLPGAWRSADNLDCKTYFAYFGRFLLNQQYTILPGVEAIRQADFLFSVFGIDDQVFVRPTSCDKQFVARLITRESFASSLAMTRYDPTSMVVVTAPKSIDREWRLVVCEDRVIAGSQYARNRIKAISPGVPEEVESFVRDMLNEVQWRPDPIFMVDICESNGKLWLVEFNSFSCSWLYQCDLAAVISEASRIAIRSWEQKRA